MKPENELALHQARMRMIGWMCGAKLRDKLSCVELRQQLGIEDIVKVVQRNRSRWHRHVLRKDDSDCVKSVLLWKLRELDKKVGPGEHGKSLWTRI